MDPTSELVSELRLKFLQKLEDQHGSGKLNYFHSYDMDRILKSDEWLRRFLIHHDNDVKNALNMLWDTCQWRKDNDVNDLNESSLNMDYLEEGSMFVHNRDRDGKLLFIFKCKKHIKGQKDFDQLKRCVIYWFERVERLDSRAMITIFFDMQDTGLSNMDTEYTKYLIGLCKLYYPNFLNYILIFEMPWILNAAFKVIKAWLPPKGVQKIKFVNKSNLKEYVDLDEALICWGGNDDYVFTFVPESGAAAAAAATIPLEFGNGKTDDSTKKKVHFADGSPMVEGTPPGFGSAKLEDNLLNCGAIHLSVVPSESVMFSEGRHSELSGVVRVTNISISIVTYKIKTTSPEKFRVRPSLGLLHPGGSASISVSVQPGFTAHSILRDKFLIMSFPIELQSPSHSELSDVWKGMDVKRISQHRLKCSVISHSQIQNGSICNIALQSHSYESDGDQKMSQIISAMNHMAQCNEKIIYQMSYISTLEKIIIFMVLLLAVAVYFVYSKIQQSQHSICTHSSSPYHPSCASSSTPPLLQEDYDPN